MTFHQAFMLYEALGILLLTALLLFCKQFKVTQFPVYHPDRATSIFDWIFAAIVVQFWLPIIAGYVANQLVMKAFDAVFKLRGKILYGSQRRE